MTVRPRYTIRAKTRDLRTLAHIAASAAAALTRAVALVIRALATTTLGTARTIITGRYTDPRENR